MFNKLLLKSMQHPQENGDRSTKTETLTRAVVRIHLYGEDFEITMDPQQSILEAALENELDPPYSCQIGICGTCRAKLVEGKVRMDEREALTDEEIEEGYILTCQAHPETPTVAIDYDQ